MKNKETIKKDFKEWQSRNFDNIIDIDDNIDNKKSIYYVATVIQFLNDKYKIWLIEDDSIIDSYLKIFGITVSDFSMYLENLLRNLNRGE